MPHNNECWTLHNFLHWSIKSVQVEEVREYKNELLDQKRHMMERKLTRAESKRQVILQMKMRKAHEEETKVTGDGVLVLL